MHGNIRHLLIFAKKVCLRTTILIALTMTAGTGWADEPATAGQNAQGSTAWTRALPNGMSVELVGVTSDPLGENAQGWWNPDGKPISDPSENGPSFHKQIGGFGEQYQRRTLYFRLFSKDGEAGVGASGAIVRPAVYESGNGYRGESPLASDAPLSSGAASWGKVAVAFNTPADDFDYRFGVSTGTWRALLSVPNTLHPVLGDVRPTITHGGYSSNMGYMVYVSIDAHPRIEEYDHGRRTKRLSMLPTGQAALGDVNRRFIAWDAQGRSVPIGRWNTQANGDADAQISPAALLKIVRFELQTRDYTWVRFDHIHNQPTLPKGEISPANDIPIPAALPQFSRILPNGSRLDIIALMRSRAEGERWWRPDGTPLKGRIKDWATDMLNPDWVRGVRPREVFVRYTSPHVDDFGYVIKTSSDADPKHIVTVENLENYAMYKTEMRSIDEPFNPYIAVGPAARKIFVRIGMTAGHWKRIASMPMTLTPQMSRNTMDGKYSYYDAVLRLNSRSSLSWYDPSGKLQEWFFIGGDHQVPSGDAQRVVAVMSDGTSMSVCFDPVYVREGSTIGEQSGFWFDQSKPHDFRQPNLSKVRRFDLEVQPYTWVTYPPIPVDPRE